MTNSSLAEARLQPISNLMTRRVLAVAPSTRVLTAEWAAARRGVRHLVVLDENRVAGVLCGSDLRDARAGAKVATCMNTPPVTVSPTTTVNEAASLLRKRAIGCLPVVAGGQLVGILTRRDLRRAGLPDEEMAAPACAACHATDHTRIDPRTGVPFCTDCLERAHDDSLEVGTVD